MSQKRCDKSLLDVANEVCRDIPAGWYLELHLEAGAGYWSLFDPEMIAVVDSEEYTSVDYTLERTAQLAVEYAIRREATR